MVNFHGLNVHPSLSTACVCVCVCVCVVFIHAELVSIPVGQSAHRGGIPWFILH